MELGLENKLAFISGSTKGIGKAIAIALAKEGVNVAINGRQHKDMADAFKEIGQYGVDVLTYLGDIRTHIEKGLDLSKFDILINNVGGYGRGKTHHQAMAMNYDVTVDLTESFLNVKRTYVKRTYGRVITISSIFGKEAGHNPYFTAANAAQIAYMKTLSRKYRQTTFNTICPGHIDVGKKFPDNPKIIGKPEDVGDLVAFLCSDKAKHINGAVITVDGGASYSF